MLRNGDETLVPNTDVLVGDVLLLDTGDKVPADGVVFQSFDLVADEASLTGESEPQHKGDEDPWCLSGTQVRNSSRVNTRSSSHHIRGPLFCSAGSSRC